MNSLFCKSRHLIRAGMFIKFRQPARGAVLLDEDWMPGPYPKNEEERLAAAKKYNLLPEEYEPLDPKWANSLGDYPCLPNRCFDDEDPYDNYEYMAHAKHFGEPIHHAWEVYGPHGMTLNQAQLPEYMSFSNAILLTLFMWVTTYWYAEYIKAYPYKTKLKPLHNPLEGEHYHYPTSDLSKYE